MKHLQLYLTAALLWPICVSGKPFHNGLEELDVVDCSASNLVPSLTDCHSFYQCHNGLAFRQSCGFLLFNPISLHCDWPQTVTRIRSECRKTFAIFPNSNEVPVKWTKRPLQTQASLAGPPRDARPRKIHSGLFPHPSIEQAGRTTINIKTTTAATTTPTNTPATTREPINSTLTTTTTITTTTTKTTTTTTTTTKTTTTTTITTTKPITSTTMTTVLETTVTTTKSNTNMKSTQVKTAVQVEEGRKFPDKEETSIPPKARSELPWSVSVVKPRVSGISFPNKFFDSGTRNSIKDSTRSSKSQEEGKTENKNKGSNNNPIPITKSPFDVEYLEYDYDMDAAVEEMAKATTTAALAMEDELFQLIYEAQSQDETIETPGKITDDDFPFVLSSPSTTPTPHVYDPFYPPFEELPDPLIFSPTWNTPTNNDLASHSIDNVVSNPVVITPDHQYAMEEPSPLPAPATTNHNIFSKLASLGTTSGMTPLLHAFKNEMNKLVSDEQWHDAANNVLTTSNIGSNPTTYGMHQQTQFTEDQIQQILSMAASNPALSSMSEDVLNHLSSEQLTMVANRIQESVVKAVQAQVNDVMESKPIIDVKKAVEEILNSEPLASLGKHIQHIVKTNPLEGVAEQVMTVVQTPEVQGLQTEIFDDDDVKLMAIKVYQFLLSKPVQNLSNGIQRSVEHNVKHLENGVERILEGQSHHIEAIKQQLMKTGRQVSDGLNGLSSMKDELFQHGGQIISGVAGLSKTASEIVAKTDQMVKDTFDCPCQTKKPSDSPSTPPEPRALLDDDGAKTQGRKDTSTTLGKDVSTYFPVLDQEGDKVTEESSSSVYYFPFVPKQSSTTKVPPKKMANCLNHFLDCLDKIKANEEQHDQVNPDNKSCQDHFQECSTKDDNNNSSSNNSP